MVHRARLAARPARALFDARFTVPTPHPLRRHFRWVRSGRAVTFAGCAPVAPSPSLGALRMRRHLRWARSGRAVTFAGRAPVAVTFAGCAPVAPSLSLGALRSRRHFRWVRFGRAVTFAGCLWITAGRFRRQQQDWGNDEARAHPRSSFSTTIHPTGGRCRRGEPWAAQGLRPEEAESVDLCASRSRTRPGRPSTCPSWSDSGRLGFAPDGGGHPWSCGAAMAHRP